MRSLAVGSGYTGTLDLEHGADALVDGPAIIGHGTSEQNYLATLTLDGAGTSNPTALYVSETLTVGHNLRGLLDITNGARVIAYNDVNLGAIEHVNPQPRPDGEISVRGENPISHQPSEMFIAGDLKLGLDLFNARSHVTIYDGAQMNVSGTMTMSVEPGSPSQLLIQGVGTQRSSLTVGAADQIKACRIGERGEARVFIYGGGWLHCYFVYVGGDSFEGDGIIVVDRRGSVTPSLLQADYALGLGTLPENNGGTGRLILRDGDVEAGTLLLFQNSSIEGSGRIRVTAVDGGIVALDGRVDPGVTIDAGEPPLEPIVDEPSRFAPQPPAALPPIIQPGALTISNSISISPTAVITLDVIGDTPSLYDRLIITGTANLGGKLVLNFGNGFAPQQGDSFAFMQAGAFAGSFQTTTIAGLAPGFTYTLSATGGTFNLVALNDGVPTTSATRYVYLPLIRR